MVEIERGSSEGDRIIALIDMDCFYCQVSGYFLSLVSELAYITRLMTIASIIRLSIYILISINDILFGFTFYRVHSPRYL